MHSNTTVRRRAPGPGKEPLLMGSLHEMRSNPMRLLLRLQREHGDVARMRLGPYVVHLVAHPEHIKYVLQDNNSNYARGRMYHQFKCFMGQGLLTNDGPAWINHRRMAQPLFNRRSVDAMATTMTDHIGAMLDRWEEYARGHKLFDIVPEMMHLSLGILSRIMFSVDLREEAESLAPAVRFSLTAMIFSGDMSQFFPSWLPLPYHRRVRRDRRLLHAVMDRIIAAHRGDNPPDDLVTLLLSAGGDAEIRDEMMTIFLAGHETSGTGLSWMLYALSRHTEVRNRLEREIEDVLGGRTPVLGDLEQMPYSRMVVEEALRLYPPIWLYPRDAARDDQIGGYHIPAGSSVFVSPYVTHRHPAFWDNPEAFDPERFTPEQVAARPRYTYFPFGGGQRQCIGNHMAMLQLQLALVMIAQRYRLHVAPGHPVEQGFLVSLRPLHGILMTLRHRAAAESTARPVVASPARVSACPFHTVNS